MLYMGSKAKYATEIVPILQKIINQNEIKTYIEPFVGGANIIDKIKCENKIGYDKNQALIALHQKGQTEPEEIPDQGNREWWDEAKAIYRQYKGKVYEQDIMEPWKIGAIGFLGSYNCGGFRTGYAKTKNGYNLYNTAYKNFTTQVKKPLYKDIDFICSDFINIPQYSNCLFYCDPPYQNMKPYGYTFETQFDYELYWNWIRSISRNNIVICSEQVFPEDFTIIWEKQIRRQMCISNDLKGIEKLGTVNKLEIF